MITTECRILHRPESDELRFLPEGPYTVSGGQLSWVGIQHGDDAITGSINVLDLTSGNNRSYDLPGRPGFAFPTTSPDVFVAGVERDLGLFHLNDGSWSVFCSGVDAAADNTIINDGIVFGDNLIFGCKHLEFSTRCAGLYLWRGSDRHLIQLRDDQICSNGKAVIKDENGRDVLIDIDSPSKTITRAELDIEGGTLGEAQTVVDLTAEEVFPDGMVVTPDQQSLIVALYDPGDPESGVARQYGLEDGELQAVWTCPGSPRVTCPQLVDVDGHVKLVLTTAVEGMEADRLRMHPHAGYLFIGETTFSATGDQPVFDVTNVT